MISLSKSTAAFGSVAVF